MILIKDISPESPSFAMTQERIRIIKSFGAPEVMEDKITYPTLLAS